MKYNYSNYFFLINSITAGNKHSKIYQSFTSLKKVEDVSSTSSSLSDIEYKSFPREDSFHLENFQYKYPVPENREHIIFMVVNRVMSTIILNHKNLTIIIKQFNKSQEAKTQLLTSTLFHNFYKLAVLRNQYIITECLDRTNLKSSILPEIYIKDVTIKILFFMAINHFPITEVEKLNFRQLKRVFYEYFPLYMIVSQDQLHNTIEHIYNETKELLEQSNLFMNDIILFLDVLNIIHSLTTYIIPLLKEIPHNTLYCMFNISENLPMEKFNIFLYIIDVVLYIFEHELFFSDYNSHTYTSKNRENIIGIVKFIGVLYQMQKNYKRENKAISYIQLQSYIDTANTVANLPENKPLIYDNYKLLLQKIKRIIKKDLGLIEASNVITQYIYCNVALFW